MVFSLASHYGCYVRSHEQTTETLSTRVRLRPDTELQRLRAGVERTTRRARLRTEGRGARAQPPGAAGRRARLPDPARPRVPWRTARASGRGRQTRAAESRPARLRRVPAARSRWPRVPFQRGVGRAP